MTKYILIATLITSHISMASEKPETKDTPPVNTNDLKTIVPSLQKAPIKKDGMAILDEITTRSGIRTISANPVAGKIGDSSLFVITPDRKSKL